MIFRKGDIFASRAEALVNPVNAVGVMGKGLALAFRQRYPEIYPAYQEACRRGLLRVGRVQVFRRSREGFPRYIINFPTKRHWREPSRLEYIEAGLEDLVGKVLALGIRSLAVPALGAGLGGLPWEAVKKAIQEGLRPLEEKGVEVVVLEPGR